MKARVEQVLLLSFPAIVVLVVAHVLGVPYARQGAMLAILVGGACLGLERLFGDRSRADLFAATLLPAGALVGAVLGVVGTGGENGALVFGPALPGLLAYYAATGDPPSGVVPGWLASR
ncbi:hypothetical protein OB905_04700 [Halobacteria archaeon AArc-dxtr1]|nr:hypothetical protein [Halobacteria archaeon AArc-dxtr1]